MTWAAAWHGRCNPAAAIVRPSGWLLVVVLLAAAPAVDAGPRRALRPWSQRLPRLENVVRVVDHGEALTRAVLRRAPGRRGRTPRVDALPVLAVERGVALGRGVEKTAYAARTALGDAVVLRFHRGQPWTKAEVHERARAEIEALGLPTVRTLGKTPGSAPGRFDLVQERMAAGSKELVAALDRGDLAALARSPLGARSLEDLRRIRTRLLRSGRFLPDLQFMVAADGSVRVNDTGSPRPAAGRSDLRQLKGLIAAARAAIDVRDGRLLAR